MNTLKTVIFEKLQSKFSPTKLEVFDETYKHVKHKQFQTGKLHFRLQISSKELSEKTTIQSHREIYACLGDLMVNNIHSLSIRIDKE